VIARVINNVDATGEGRVQIELPWLAGARPWARLSRLDSGTYFVPQRGDEVLVSFNHGDVRDPYVLGSLWNSKDRPPAEDLKDPATKRIIRTPAGHDIQFDDLTQSIRIRHAGGHSLTIELDQVRIEARDPTGNRMASVTLTAKGDLSLEAARSIELKAPSISIKSNVLNIQSDGRAEIKAAAACSIEAPLVKIN
jgi:uncharacterized protein involved in type VI secretion and phage assembly